MRYPSSLFVRAPRPTDQGRPTLCRLNQGHTCHCCPGPAGGQFRLPTLLLVSRPGCEPQLLARDWRVAVEHPGENLSSLSVGVSTQPILYKDGTKTTLG